MSLMETDGPPRVSRRRFSKEFKADAVALVLDGDRPAAAVARDLGIGEGTPVNWVRQARAEQRRRWRRLTMRCDHASTNAPVTDPLTS